MFNHSLSTATPSAGRWAAILFVAQFILIWTTFLILSNAIGWPASLDDPASVALPRLIAHRGEVLIGYSCYLLGALLLVPAVAALNARMSLNRDLASLTIGLSAMSATAKVIGISRWLFAMPMLAQDWVTPHSNRGEIALLYRTLNDYAGGIGEIVGVGLISGALTVLIGLALLRSAAPFSRLLGGFTLIAGLSLFLNIPAGFGIEMGGVLTFSNIAWQFALLGIGLWSLTWARG